MPTDHPNIVIANPHNNNMAHLTKKIEKLEQVVLNSPDKIRPLLSEIVHNEIK